MYHTSNISRAPWGRGRALSIGSVLVERAMEEDGTLPCDYLAGIPGRHVPVFALEEQPSASRHGHTHAGRGHGRTKLKAAAELAEGAGGSEGGHDVITVGICAMNKKVRYTKGFLCVCVNHREAVASQSRGGRYLGGGLFGLFMASYWALLAVKELALHPP